MLRLVWVWLKRRPLLNLLDWTKWVSRKEPFEEIESPRELLSKRRIEPEFDNLAPWLWLNFSTEVFDKIVFDLSNI